MKDIIRNIKAEEKKLIDKLMELDINGSIFSIELLEDILFELAGVIVNLRKLEAEQE